jgi:hypothetical protein
MRFLILTKSVILLSAKDSDPGSGDFKPMDPDPGWNFSGSPSFLVKFSYSHYLEKSPLFYRVRDLRVKVSRIRMLN